MFDKERLDEIAQDYDKWNDLNNVEATPQKPRGTNKTPKKKKRKK